MRHELAKTADMRLIGYADRASDARELCARLGPDVLLFGSRSRELLALKVIEQLHQQFPYIPILLLAEKHQVRQAMAAIAAGACGILLKSDPLPLLEVSIRAVNEGGTWLSPSILPSVRAPARAPDLTSRQRQILSLLARGWDNSTLAAELHLAEQTIRNYMSQLYGTLEVSARSEAILWALDNDFGNVSLPEESEDGSL